MGGCIGEILLFQDSMSQSQEQGYADAIVSAAQLLLETRSISSCAAESAFETNKNRLLTSMLPVALYSHDDCQKLREVIRDSVPERIQNEAFVVTEGLAASLTGKMVPLELLPDLIQLLPDDGLSQKLRQVQALLMQRDSLAIAAQKLGNPQQIEVAISLAFYCWLSTAEQFQLSILHAQRIPNVSPLTLVLTGALSGALNGQGSIPLPWQAKNIASPGIALQQMEQLADQLLSAWSGCYQVKQVDVDRITRQAAQPFAISAPGILRPRDR